MDDEARATRPRPRAVTGRRSSGPRRGRRSPYRHPRQRRSAPGRPADRVGPTYAALDLGTNNCRLLVARPTGDSFRVVDAFSRIIRLGEGVSTLRPLSEAAIARAVEALRVCRDKMRNRGVTRARLIATEACRAAGNGAEFLRAHRASEVGLELEIVDRETEAPLAATGCTPLVDPRRRGRRSCSTSAAAPPSSSGSAARRRPARPAACRRSRPGLAAGRRRHARRAPRRHHGHAARSIEAMVAEVAAFVDALRRRARRRRDDRMHMLGTSGTVTTIAGVHLELPRYDRRRVDGCWMDDDEVTRRGRAAAGHELRGARRQSLHRRRARRSGARRLRHPRSDPPRVSRASGCASPTAACAKACWCR